MATISAPGVLVGGRISGPTTVSISPSDDHRITHVGQAGDADVVLPHGFLSPGLIDLQINGAYGSDFVTAEPDEWLAVARRLPETGVTSFLPTFITGDLDTLRAALVRAGGTRDVINTAAGASGMVGIHLEGPFLSPERAGTHPRQYLREPSPELLAPLLEDTVRRVLAVVTLAPELPGGLDAVRRFSEAGIKVSIGHSDATAAEVEAAADAGATMVTHLFNAQRGLGHREPGVVGAALTDPRLTPGLIADLHHVAPSVCSLVLKVAADRTALVTDAMAAAGMPPGRYQLGDVDVTLVDGDVPRNLDGGIAGSALTLDAAVRNLVALGHDVAEILTCATTVPADALDRADLGRVEPGARADLVWWSDDLTVLRTWVGGRVAYEAPGAV